MVLRITNQAVEHNVPTFTEVSFAACIYACRQGYKASVTSNSTNLMSAVMVGNLAEMVDERPLSVIRCSGVAGILK